MRPSQLLFISAMASSAMASLGRFRVIDDNSSSKRNLQNIVTWDDKSLFINGERIMIFSGEFHPFRTPVPDLWLDVFHKVKALGMNTVSFYIDWAVLEGKPGNYRAEGPLALEPFFEAAKKAGIYLIARPGPYINAEVSGGGFPGWLQRLNATLRTKQPGYLDATATYMSNIAKAIAKAQITNGGPVILYQPENEYTWSANGEKVPDGEYMRHVIDQARKEGIVVPMISNDAAPNGNLVPGSGVGAVDIYGHDAYYLGPDDCKSPTVWPKGRLSTNFRDLHLRQSPSTPYSLLEFQAGCWLPWGGTTYDNCVALLNEEYQRVYYKNDYSFGVTIFNLYMTAGGTNWGNMGFPSGYTSYDYAAAIAEDRTITREKYSELKLQANFLKVSPSYLTAKPQKMTTGIYTDGNDLTVTPLMGNGTDASYYVVRHTDETSHSSTPYMLKVKSSKGDVIIPQIGGNLTLNGRDSKIHVVDYSVGGINLVYSSAEIFTWKKFEDISVLIVYGGPGERHELEIQTNSAKMLKAINDDESLTTRITDDSIIINWMTSPERRILQIDNLQIFILDRQSAYQYWVPELSTSKSRTPFTTRKSTENSIIIKGGYLVRTAYVDSDNLYLVADIDATTDMEIIGAPIQSKRLFINNAERQFKIDDNGIWSVSLTYTDPNIVLPNLESLSWKHIDSLPEIQDGYDDSHWKNADLKSTYNNRHPISTPVSLYGADYGFNTGYLIFRGQFKANGNETTLKLRTQGGSAFGTSVWINKLFVGSWNGSPAASDHTDSFKLPNLKSGEIYTFTVLVDQTGFEENGAVGDDVMKAPRGILSYELDGHAATDMLWKLTGNLGGEDYHDHVRGPLNEGGLYAERQGWHQPNPPTESWTERKVTDKIFGSGVAFFTTSFNLDIPEGYDVPLYLSLANATTNAAQAYRLQIYVNGYQFGKYIHHIGPQKDFHVPQGILNYKGKNWMAISIWTQDDSGAAVGGIQLKAMGKPVQTGYGRVGLADAPDYKKRDGAY